MTTPIPTSGVRAIDDLEEGCFVWLHGPTDLDDVMLELVAHLAREGEGWLVTRSVLRPGAEKPAEPDVDIYDPSWLAAWNAYGDAMRATHVDVIEEDLVTDEHLPVDDYEVRWYRRVPDCPVGCEGHDYHIVPCDVIAEGAHLGILVSW